VDFLLGLVSIELFSLDVTAEAHERK